MQLKSALRKSAELGIGLTAVATLILAGCGGGSSTTTSNGTNGTNSTPTAAVKITTTVTPGKGIMIGANVSIKAADGTTVLGTATTTAAGIAAVEIPATSIGPFIVSVTCPATCQYFDEKSGTLVYGSASAPAMLAVVPTAAYLNIGVTAATNAAAAYAIAAGTLTTTSVIAANNVVIANLGLVGVTDLLTPPTIISSAATLSAAQAGTSAADQLANYSASIAIAASGVSAIQAIADYGNAWKQAALTPASGVVLPATIDSAVLLANAPTFPVITIGDVTPQMAAAATAAASAVVAVNSWVAEVSVPGNSNGYWENIYYADAAAMASGVQTTDVYGWTDTVAVSGNSLTFSGADKKLVGSAWVIDTDPVVNYHLGSTGWMLGNNGGTVVNNLDGTITVTPDGMGSSVEKVTRSDLSSTAIPCNNAVCTGSATFPAGSMYSSSREINPVDHYKVSNGSARFPTKVTNMSGGVLNAMPTGAFCVQDGPGAQILKPIIPAPAAGADNFNVYGAWNCSATEIANQNAFIAGGGLPQATALLTVKQTGNAVVPSVGLVTLTTPAAQAALPWMINKIIALRAGQMYPGNMTPAGSFGHMDGYNKTAITKYLSANGRPALP